MKILCFCLLLAPISLMGQQSLNFADATLSGANYQGALSLSYVHLWQLGAKKKFSMGLGGRFTSYLGANQYYITAPAELTSGSSSPFIIFQDNITANIDSFFVKSPQVNCLNLSLNFEYQLTKKFSAGFNIDAMGLSFGSSVNGNYINGSAVRLADAKPSSFNLLLVSDNDRGSLNSEMFARYAINARWALKLGAQFLFTEYTTSFNVQSFPSDNNRFRNKSLMVCLGISKKLSK